MLAEVGAPLAAGLVLVLVLPVVLLLPALTPELAELAVPEVLVLLPEVPVPVPGSEAVPLPFAPEVDVLGCRPAVLRVALSSSLLQALIRLIPQSPRMQQVQAGASDSLVRKHLVLGRWRASPEYII